LKSDIEKNKKEDNQIPPNKTGITSVSLENEMRKSYLDYAMSVIVARSVPDIRDGLKPVHRRILYSMNESNYVFNKPYRKSARIVGDVMGKYHPHGDAAIYDAMVRMAQDFSMRLELIDGQGNFGSMDGDPPAAMRYTEARLAKIANYLVDDLDKETVDFNANYDETAFEPVVLPAKYPNILINGAVGIAVGMATSIPPHNLREVIDATIALIENNNLSVSDLNKIIKGPDFPTGGIILNKEGIKSTYETGRGSCTIRSKTSFEDINKDKKAIIIHEIPFQVNKSRLLEKIAETVNNKIIEGVSDIRDESDRKGVRIVIELKRDVEHEIILNKLFKFTPLQSTFSSNILALNDGKPEQLNLKQILNAFIVFRKKIITKRTIFNLNQSRKKAHVLIGFVISNLNLDKILNLIRKSKNTSEAKKALMNEKWRLGEDIIELVKLIENNEENLVSSKYSLSEEQSKAILELRLHRLTSLEREEIKTDLNKVIKEINNYLEILNSDEILFKKMKEEMNIIKEEFSTERKSIILENQPDENYDEIKYIQKEDIVITLSHRGYIKRVPLKNYKSQKRGGKGRTGMATRDNDFVSQIFVVSTHTKLLIFSSFGKVYSLNSYDIPEGSLQSRGKPIINILPIKNDEIVSAVVPLPINEEEWNKLYIMFATSFGMIRKNKLIDVAKSGQQSLRESGKTAIKLNKDDKLIGVNLCRDVEDTFLSTTDGKCLRFPIAKIRLHQGLMSKGVKGIKLKDKNKVISMCTLIHSKIDISIRKEFLKYSSGMRKDNKTNGENSDFIELRKQEEFIFSITSKGIGKRSSAYEYRIANRGGYGITGIIKTNKSGDVINSFPVENDDEIILVTNGGKIIRIPVKDVRIAGRSTKGVSIFKIPDTEEIVSVTKVKLLDYE
tara:strand:- start:5019 stop:7715 length:2697 start_codon:yes stop_codon:yes gene_type:complete